MKLSLDIKASLSQTLTPQQIQYLKLLQLPVMQLEQQVRQEIEQNPMLEEFALEDLSPVQEAPSLGDDFHMEQDRDEMISDDFDPSADVISPEQQKLMIDDQGDPFEFYKLLWQDGGDENYSKQSNYSESEDDNEPFQIKYHTSFIEDLLDQFRLLPLDEEEIILGEQIIGNVDNDGYLRRNLQEIINETNSILAELNIAAQTEYKHSAEKIKQDSESVNPARQFAISSNMMHLLDLQHSFMLSSSENGTAQSTPPPPRIRRAVTIEDGENMIRRIQSLDPPGVASRSVQECLSAQLRFVQFPTESQSLALEILERAYEPFSMKHYPVIMKQFSISEDQLRKALEVIRRLNPKPGGGEMQSEMNAVTPDFMIERDEENGELIISVNDSRLPALRLNKAYEKLKKEARFRHFNKDTKEWIRNKYEEAKFLMQAIRQRKATMLKVMTSIAGLQRAFFEEGPMALRPLIYKDVSENTGLDISTICRIVNGKYVQCEFGTFELKSFFSEALPNEDGEEVATAVIKQVIKEIVDSEPKNKPHSDDRICKELKNKGYQVARRTVAKYREQLRIPVARLRKEL